MANFLGWDCGATCTLIGCVAQRAKTLYEISCPSCLDQPRPERARVSSPLPLLCAPHPHDTPRVLQINRVSFMQGIVVLWCQNCNQKHLIADNLGKVRLESRTQFNSTLR